jgi:hypothetical protein
MGMLAFYAGMIIGLLLGVVAMAIITMNTKGKLEAYRKIISFK